MLKINLLPIDKRRPERTPLPRFLAILGGTALTLTFFAFIVYIYMVKYSSTQTEYNNEIKKLQELKKENGDYPAMKAEYDYLAENVSALDQIQGTRKLVWHKMIDKLCTIFDDSKAWMTSISGSMAGEKPEIIKDAKAKKEFEVLYKLKMNVLTAGLSYEAPAALRTKLYNAFAFFENPPDPKNVPQFVMSPPTSLNTVIQPQFAEKIAMAFDVEIGHVQEKLKPQKPGPPAKPAGKK